MVASKLCSAHGAGEFARTCLRAPVGRNRFIAPSAAPRAIPFGSDASGGARRRNKTIAPYDPHFVSFNFTNALICAVGSSLLLTAPLPARARRRRLPRRRQAQPAVHGGRPFALRADLERAVVARQGAVSSGGLSGAPGRDKMGLKRAATREIPAKKGNPS